MFSCLFVLVIGSGGPAVSWCFGLRRCIGFLVWSAVGLC